MKLGILCDECSAWREYRQFVPRLPICSQRCKAADHVNSELLRTFGQESRRWTGLRVLRNRRHIHRKARGEHLGQKYERSFFWPGLLEQFAHALIVRGLVFPLDIQLAAID